MTTPLERLETSLADRYRIERELGAGGMATVYLARDLKHDRDVALKVLKPELAAVLGAERFVVEIKTTASLQHPHILPLFDSGSADGFLYYVMPFVEGETLRDKLDRETQLSIEEAVRITTEVADALDYAHRRGVIHRDIKPENILLHDGRPMVADFGIALALSAAAGGRMTETGLSLGTPHYMSPEQATAEKDLTNRSDIYSLGCVLYEMLTGNPPHVGASAQQIIMKIVTEVVPPVAGIRKSVPPNVAAAAMTALERLPADRFTTAKQFAEALSNPAFSTPSSTRSGAAGPRRSRISTYSLATACVALAAVAAWALLRPAPEPPVAKQWIGLDVSRPGGLPGPGWALTTAIAPGGSAIVFADSFQQESNAPLQIKERGNAQAVPLLGSAGGTQPFFSPDGRWVGFATRAGLYKVPRGGGAPELISDSGTNREGGTVAPGAWLDDGSIVFMNRSHGRLMQVTAGGTLRSVAAIGGPGLVVQLRALPGSRGVLAVTCQNFPCTAGALLAVDLRRDTVLTLVNGPTGAWYLEPGFIVYGDGDGTLVAQQFDPGRLTLSGAAVAVLNGVGTTNGLIAAAMTKGGALLYESGSAEPSRLELAEVTRGGVAAVLDSTVRLAALGTGGVSISPDGRRVALVQTTPQGTDVYVKVLPDGPVTRLTFGGDAFRPSWSADGHDVLYIARSGAEQVVMERPADGSGADSEVLRQRRSIAEALESPDGKWLIWRTDQIAPGGADILARHTSGDTTSLPLAATSFQEGDVAVSPDSRWIAYVSDQNGGAQVFVRPLSPVGGHWQVSNGPGWEPQWSHDGRELFFVGPSGMMAASISFSPSFHVTGIQALFKGPYVWGDPTHPMYAVTRDGHFLVARSSGHSLSRGDTGRLILVQHWISELRPLLEERGAR